MRVEFTLRKILKSDVVIQSGELTMPNVRIKPLCGKYFSYCMRADFITPNFCARADNQRVTGINSLWQADAAHEIFEARI